MGEMIRCKKYGDILQSKYRHNFQMCRCGSCYKDGRDDYCRVDGNKEDIEWLDIKDKKNSNKKKRLKSYLYTKGKFGKRFREVLDTNNEYLYSHGRYPTKTRKEDLTEDYIEFRSRVIWYMTGYVKTSGIVDIGYKSIKINHLFKDDYLYISYKEKLKFEKNIFGFCDYTNYDICICGNSIIPILFAIEENSKININGVKEKIYEKVDWYKNHYKEDYLIQFDDENVDIFEYYKKCY